MANVQINQKVFQLANKLHIEIFHFACGTFPEAPQLYNSRPVNRLFVVTENIVEDSSHLDDCNGIIPLRADHAYLIPAFHTSRWILTNNLRFISIHFKAEFITGIDFFSASGKIYSVGGASLVAEAKSIWEQADQFVAAAQLKSLCFRVCSDLFRFFSPVEFDVVTRFVNFQRIVEYVEHSGNAKTKVSELARVVKMRTDVFSRKFTSETGLTPKLFLNRSLTRKAGELLKRGKRNFEIADILQFNNEFYFSRFFKKMTGFSPVDYRKNY